VQAYVIILVWVCVGDPNPWISGHE